MRALRYVGRLQGISEDDLKAGFCAYRAQNDFRAALTAMGLSVEIADQAPTGEVEGLVYLPLIGTFAYKENGHFRTVDDGTFHPSDVAWREVSLNRLFPQQHCARLGPWRRSWQWIQSERRSWGRLFGYAVLGSALALVLPVTVQALVNMVAGGAQQQAVVALAGIFLLLMIAMTGIRILEAWVVEMTARRIFSNVAQDLGARLQRWGRASQPGHTLQPYNAPLRFFDVITMDKAFTAIALDGVGAIAQIVAGILLMGIYHPALLVTGAAITLGLALAIVLPAQRGLRTSLSESSAKYAVGEWLRDLGSRPAVTLALAGAENTQTLQMVHRWLNEREKHFSVVIRQKASMLLLQAIAHGAVLAVGGLLALQGSISLGALVASELVVAMTVGSIGKLGKLVPKVYDFVTALEKIGQAIDHNPNALPPEPFTRGSGDQSSQLVSLNPSERRIMRQRFVHDRPQNGIYFDRVSLSALDQRLFAESIDASGIAEVLRSDGIGASDVHQLVAKCILAKPHEILFGDLYDELERPAQHALLEYFKSQQPQTRLFVPENSVTKEGGYAGDVQ